MRYRYLKARGRYLSIKSHRSRHDNKIADHGGINDPLVHIHFLPSIIQVLLARNDQRVLLPKLGPGRIYNFQLIIVQGFAWSLASIDRTDG
jgi:hypothetical protein